jgi:hypothetical protein
MCVETLAGIARAGTNENARVNAASTLLDRGWGKALTTLADADGGPLTVTIRQIIDVVQHSPAKVIEHDPNEG